MEGLVYIMLMPFLFIFLFVMAYLFRKRKVKKILFSEFDDGEKDLEAREFFNRIFKLESLYKLFLYIQGIFLIIDTLFILFGGYKTYLEEVEFVKEFKDYYGFTHQVGEKFYFACVYFLPHEDGYTLYISKDKINISNIFLQDRAETQKEICYNLKEYFKIIEQGRFKRD